MRAAVAALLVLLAAVGCEFSSVPSADLGGTPAPSATASGPPGASGTPTSPSETPSREDFLTQAAAGSWRPAALPLTPGVLDEFEARCVVAGFPDESEVEAAKGGGWWAMWWPGSETTITIAALNRQSLAIDSLAPDGPPSESP